MARVAAALPALDPTLAGAANTTLGKMEHELQALHNKIIHAAKTSRRDAAPPVHTRAGAGVPAWSSAGANARRSSISSRGTVPGSWIACCEDLPLAVGEHTIITL